MELAIFDWQLQAAFKRFPISISVGLASRPPNGIVPNDREWHCPALSLFGRYILTLLFTTDFCAPDDSCCVHNTHHTFLKMKINISFFLK
jgi:hypothetical protein